MMIDLDVATQAVQTHSQKKKGRKENALELMISDISVSLKMQRL